MSHDIEQHNAAPSATRRTVLTGAAWSVPVIAAASLAPLAAASDTVTLAFDKSTYNGTACGTITGAYVTVTVNGTATAGRSVTTTLSNGYTFQGGSTSDSQLSGTDGRVFLPTIDVPASGGTSVLSAATGSPSAGGSSASATIFGTSLSSSFVYRSGEANLTAAVPAGSIPLEAGWFLSGTKMYDWQGNVVSSDVIFYSSGWVYSDGTNHVAVTTSTGQSYIYRKGKTTLTPAVPNGSTPLNSGYFLKNGTLYHWEGDTIATNVAATSTGWSYPTSGVDHIAVRTQDGASHIYRCGRTTLTPNIPTGCTPLNSGYFLKDGKIYRYDGAEIASNVAATSTGWTYSDGTNHIAARLTSGESYIYREAKSTITPNVPTGSTPLNSGYFLVGTTLYDYQGNVTAENVSATSAGWTYTDGSNQIDACTTPPC